MSTGRVTVYTTNKLFEAEMVRQFLSDRDVSSFILNKMDSAYHFGEIEILVSRDDVIRAKKLIEDFFRDE